MGGMALLLLDQGTTEDMPGVVWDLLPGLYALAVSVLSGAAPDAASKPPDATVRSPCELVFASGAPLRKAEETRIVMRLEARCEQPHGRLRWYANGNEIHARRVSANGADAFFLILIGRLESERLTVAVSGDSSGGTIIGTAATGTKALRGPLATLELPGQGAIDFIPMNREARVNVLVEASHLILLPVAGSYKVRRDASGTFVQGVSTADGPVSLRFSYRVQGLPGDLANMDLAVVTEAIARPIRVAPLQLRMRARTAVPQ